MDKILGCSRNPKIGEITPELVSTWSFKKGSLNEIPSSQTYLFILIKHDIKAGDYVRVIGRHNDQERRNINWADRMEEMLVGKRKYKVEDVMYNHGRYYAILNHYTFFTRVLRKVE